MDFGFGSQRIFDFSSLSLSLLLTFRNLMKDRQLEGFSPEISLLHMNCEGCEWEMLETLLKEADVIKKVP